MSKININDEIRADLKDWQPYSSARSIIQSKDDFIFLDANENPFGQWNRYPDPYHEKLKRKISEIRQVDISRIFLGNGSDEVIDLCMRLLCEPKKDSVLICPPTYGMYKIFAKLNQLKVLEVSLTYPDFQINWEALKQTVISDRPKIIIICSPNNPTGNVINNIERIFDFYEGWVIIDEAYIDFCIEKTYLPLLQNDYRLIIVQTLSKAWALAGARIGFAISNPELIQKLYSIKPPYNISQPAMQTAISFLEKHKDEVLKNVKLIITERENLISELKKISFIDYIFPTDANFILIKTRYSNEWRNFLLSKKIVIRDKSFEIPSTVRVTVGSPEENLLFLEYTKQFQELLCR